MSNFARITTICLLLSLQWVMASPAAQAARLEPHEVAVLVCEGSKLSRDLAIYYCEQRKIPTENICSIPFPAGETLPRNVWEEKVRPSIRQWLSENDPDQKIRCWVTTWDVPMAISSDADLPETKQWQEFYQHEYDVRLAATVESIESLWTLTGDAANKVEPLPTAISELQEIAYRAIEEAQAAANKLPAAEQATRNREIQDLLVLLVGYNPLINAMEQSSAGQAASESLIQLRTRRDNINSTLGLVEQLSVSLERETLILALVGSFSGSLDSLLWLETQLAMVRENDNGAALDSELAAVRWGDYRRLGSEPNYSRSDFEDLAIRKYRPTMIVSRLDGPTPQIAKQLVDRAIAAEQGAVWQGNIYLDARGLTSGTPAVLRQEGSLRNAARFLQDFPAYPTKLNAEARLFGDGECPNTIFYCGWYSLGKYIPAFTFRPGAVAWHMTPGEALALRGNDQRGWVASLLTDANVVITMGTIGGQEGLGYPEPALVLYELLTSDWSTGEIVTRNRPTISDKLVVFGDPLFRPKVSSIAGDPRKEAKTK